MHSRFMTLLAGGASLLTLTAIQPAIAQNAAQSDQPAASASSGLEEVVVTARRKEEKAQSVPIALQTFSPKGIENNNITSIRDLEVSTPQVLTNQNRGFGSLLWIRGVQGALTYFNEVPLVNFGGYSLFFDTANVQVLKGPQGTLFGQAADGGVILYTAKPTVNAFEGSVEAEAGDYGHRHFEGVLNVPLVDDKVVLRVGAQFEHTDGFVKDLTTGVETGSQDYWIARGTLTLRPTDDFQNDFLMEYYYSDSIQEQTVVPVVNPDPNSIQTKALGGVLATAVALRQTEAAIQNSLGPYAFVGGTYRPGGEFNSNATYDLIDTSRWDFNDNLTFKNILAYQQYSPGPINAPASAGNQVAHLPLSAASQAQLDAHPLGIGSTVAGNTAGILVQYSEEIQALGKLFDGKLSYAIGSFNDVVGTRQNPAGPLYTATPTLTGGSVSGQLIWGNQRTNGVYTQGTYDLSAIAEGLSFTAGFRYTWDKQHQTSENASGAGVIATPVSVTGYFKAPSYNFSLDYQLSPETMIYVTNSKGYSKGGFNGGNAAFFPALASYQPESLKQYEIGIKTDFDFYGVKARTNLAGYYGFYNKVQAVIGILVPSPLPGVAPASANITQNAAVAHLEGIDGEFTIVPTDGLTLSANIGWEEFKYDTWVSAGVDLHGTNQYYTPQLQYLLNGTYRLPVLGWIAPGQDLGDLSFSISYQWQAHYWGGLAYPNPAFDIIPSHDNTNMNLNWTNMFGRAGLDGRAYVTNATGTVIFSDSGASYRFDQGGSVGHNSAVPRMWGVTLRYSFGP